MSAPVVPQAKTPKSKAGLLTRPFRSLPGGRLAKSAKVPEQLSGASGADFRKTQKPVVTRLFGLTAAGTVADSHGVPLAIAGAKIGIFPKKQEPPQKKRCTMFSDGEVTKEQKFDFSRRFLPHSSFRDRKSNFPANFSPHSHLSCFKYIDNQRITKTQTAFGYFLRYPKAGLILLIY